MRSLECYRKCWGKNLENYVWGKTYTSQVRIAFRYMVSCSTLAELNSEKLGCRYRNAMVYILAV